MTKTIKNISASVHQRLLDKAKDTMRFLRESFEDVVTEIKNFLGPVVAFVVDGRTFDRSWNASGTWL